MSAMWGALGPSLPFIAIAVGFIVIGFFQHLEKMRKLDNFHRERMAAIQKGLPPPEMPTEPAASWPPPARPTPNAALLTGILFTTISMGVMAILFVNLEYEYHGFWILPLPVFLVGFGLMLFHFLKQDSAK